MASTKPRYPIEEIARRGDALYKTQVLPYLKAEDNGKFVAVDIECAKLRLPKLATSR